MFLSFKVNVLFKAITQTSTISDLRLQQQEVSKGRIGGSITALIILFLLLIGLIFKFPQLSILDNTGKQYWRIELIVFLGICILLMFLLFIASILILVSESQKK